MKGRDHKTNGKTMSRDNDSKRRREGRKNRVRNPRGRRGAAKEMGVAKRRCRRGGGQRRMRGLDCQGWMERVSQEAEQGDLTRFAR